MRYIRSIIIILLTLFCGISCERQVKFETNPGNLQVSQGDVYGTVDLPEGSNLKSDNLSVFTLDNGEEAPVHQGSFKIPNTDISHYRLLPVFDTENKIVLFGVQLPGHGTVKINAVSTASAILMINPLVTSLDDLSKTKLMGAYQRHPAFDKLVEKVESIISQGHGIFEVIDKELIDIVESINTFPEIKEDNPNVRKSAELGLIRDDNKIDIAILSPNEISIYNRGSGLPHHAGLYHESKPQENRLESANLGLLRFENTSIGDLFHDVGVLIDRFSDCFDYFGTREVPSDCNTFYTVKERPTINHRFDLTGNYKLKISNPWGNSEGTERFNARLDALYYFTLDILSLVNKSFAQKAVNSPCFKNTAFKMASHGFAQTYMGTTAISVSESLYENFKTLVDDLGECLFVEASDIKKLETVKQFTKFMDYFSKVGAGNNLLLMTWATMYDKSEYEICLQYVDGELKICEASIITNEATDITKTNATLSGTIQSFGGNNIVKFGFLAGDDPTSLRAVEGLYKNIQDIPGGISMPYHYTMKYDFSGEGKRYFQAFIQAHDGELIKGEIREFIPGEDSTAGENSMEYVPMAVSTGDPHLTTMDRFKYSFMAAGEFIGLKSTSDRFEIQARQEPFGDHVSLNTAVAIHTGSDEVCVLLDEVYLNKKAMGLYFTDVALNDGGNISNSGNKITVRTPNNDQVEVRLFSESLDYSILLNPNRKGKVKGILGNYDGNPANDLITQTGQSVPNTFSGLYPGFADSWRISQVSSLFVYKSGKNTNSYTDRSFPKAPFTLTNNQRENARRICVNAGVSDPVILENCITDVALTGDNSFADRNYWGQQTGSVYSAFSITDFINTPIAFYNFPDLGPVHDIMVTNSAWVFKRERYSLEQHMSMLNGVDISNGFDIELNISMDAVSRGFSLVIYQKEFSHARYNDLATPRLHFDFDYEDRIGTVAFQPYLNFGVEGYFNSWRREDIRIDSQDIYDGNPRILKISEKRTADGRWRLNIFYQNSEIPIFSEIYDKSISQELDSNVGYLEFSNRSYDTEIKVSNIVFKSN